MDSQTLAAVVTAPRGPVRVVPVAIREPGTGEVLVKMEACGLCHSDIFVSSLEKLPISPLILGHEGIGRVEAVGAGDGGFARGDRVGITFLAASCGLCEFCFTGRERFCLKQRNFGFTVPGVLAEYATVPVPHLFRVPENVEAAEVAPLCCAGWTAYGAVRESGLRMGQTVALFGMGGLGHLAIQYARHLGLSVAAVDTSEPKLKIARELGAELALPAAGAGRTLQKQYGGLDGAIVLTASIPAIQEAFRCLKRTGILVLVGLTNDRFELPVLDLILKGITVRGSYLGTRQDMEEVFRLAAAGVVRPHVETHALNAVPALLDRMRRGELTGRAVITFGKM
jgi:propanol-preferring alcohol dehydrogenase